MGWLLMHCMLINCCLQQVSHKGNVAKCTTSLCSLFYEPVTDLPLYICWLRLDIWAVCRFYNQDDGGEEAWSTAKRKRHWRQASKAPAKRASAMTSRSISFADFIQQSTVSKIKSQEVYSLLRHYQTAYKNHERFC
jgi:hypothetical protein